jgi:hypothetical protein
MIDANKWYGLEEAIQKDFPPLGTKFKIRNWITAGKLKAVKIGKGQGTRYSIKGVWIIHFKAKWEAGDFHS